MQKWTLQLIDQTGIIYIPTSSWTMEQQGSRQVKIIEKDDKHQITEELRSWNNGRSELNLAAEYPALLIFHNFNGQCTKNLLKMIDDSNINTVIIPMNCTDRLQPLDLSINKAVTGKNFLKK